ncbi:winged helix DNA-binding domain-containing protein [Arthrobacter sp. NPDC057013]|uniref:winged helix DNA-binding domain-containing protein n=1 Tax=Arthrobacter sp. NPDC057013 TaxID=3345999 RepID=UPI00362EF3F0
MTDGPEREYSWAQVSARRLERQWLAAPSQAGSPSDIVRAMCGAHAQVMTAAELSVGMRSTVLSRADVRSSLREDGTLVRTFGPRGTVHLLPASDLSLWTGALGAMPPNPALGQFLTPAQTDEVVAAIADALRAAELTVDELTDAIAARAGSWAAEPVMPAFQAMWPRCRAAMGTAGFRGALCFGAGRGRAATYLSPGQLAPGFRPAEAGTALGWLLRSYLQAYGPATPPNFARWLGVPHGWAAGLFGDHREDLAPVTVEGSPAWVLRDDAAAITTEPSGVRLLPYFDAYVVAGQPRERLFPGEASTRALARGQAGNYPVILVDGVVRGLWHHRRSGKKLEITAELFGPAASSRLEELRQQAERMGRFLESEVRVTLGRVDVGGHA